MPMEDSYWEGMKSPIADMKNAGAVRYGGAITAALFLKQYIDPKKVCLMLRSLTIHYVLSIVGAGCS